MASEDRLRAKPKTGCLQWHFDHDLSGTDTDHDLVGVEALDFVYKTLVHSLLSTTFCTWRPACSTVNNGEHSRYSHRHKQDILSAFAHTMSASTDTSDAHRPPICPNSSRRLG